MAIKILLVIITASGRTIAAPGYVNLYMPAKSKKQQMAAGAALAAKRGEKKKSSLKGASKSMAKSMSKKELKKMAGTKRKNLPKKKSSSKK